MKLIELEVDLNSKTKGSRWNIFWFSLIVIFIVVVLQHFNINVGSFKLVSPVTPENQILQKIAPKLENKPNDFMLKKSRSIIEESYAASPLDGAKAYAAVDLETGEVLVEKNFSERLPVASLTKIMTAVVVLDLAESHELFTVSNMAERQIPTKIGVVTNQKMTVEELLNALLLTSANDAAQVLKDGINEKYGSEVFIRAMNEKAKFLGLKNTSFSNPQGFDSRKNFSTVEDLAILTGYALRNYPLFYEIVKKDYEFLAEDKNHKQFDLYNWNGLLGVYPGVFGVKIGNTDSAGNTTVVASIRENKKVLAVILGAPGIIERDLWASQVLDIGFEKLAEFPKIGISESDLKQKYGTWKYWN